MEEIAITTTKSPEEMMGELVGKMMLIIFACMSVGIVVIIETLILNRGCTL